MSFATVTNGLYLMKALSGQPDVAVLEDNAISIYDPVKTELFSIEPFFPVHLSPVITKGDSSLKINKSDETKSNPYKLTLESAPANNTEKAVNFQRIKLIGDHFGIEYDFNAAKNDIGRISIKDKNVGLNLYKSGEWNGDDKFYSEAWKTMQSGKNSFLIDVGLGHGNKTKPQYFIIGNVVNDKLFLEAGLFAEGNKFFKPSESFYGYAGFDFDKVYAGVGKNPDKLVGIAGIKGFEDFGNLTYALYNPETKAWNVKSQTSFKNANQGFFNKKLFDYAGELFSVPPFFPVHFSPVMTKGDVTMKLMGNGDPKQTELEAMVGLDNAILPFAVGVNNLSKDGLNNTNVVLELYKGFKGKGFDGYVETRYNARTGDIAGYIVLNYELR